MNSSELIRKNKAKANIFSIGHNPVDASLLTEYNNLKGTSTTACCESIKPCYCASIPKTPDAPEILDITSGDRVLYVEVSPPNSGGYQITGYQYSATTDPDEINFQSAQRTGSTVVIPNLTNGTTYYIRIRAINIFGPGASSEEEEATPIIPPSAPEITGITPGDEVLYVAFNPPQNLGGAQIDYYLYSVTTDPNITNFSDDPVGTSSPIFIDNLENGTLYYIRIRAVNSAGPGAVSNQQYSTPRGPPGEPIIESIISDNNGLTLKIIPPGDTGGSPIQNYRYSTNNGCSFTETGNANTTIPITGLTNGSQYYILLQAYNGNSWGPNSVMQSGVPGVPGKPIITQITPSDESLSIAFEPPLTGPNPTGYEYSFFKDAQTTTSPIVINNLVNGKTYNMTIRAFNSVGSGPESSMVPATPITTPSAPDLLPLIVLSPTSLQVPFNPPAEDGGGPITNYMYSLDSTDPNDFVSANTKCSPFTIGGLTQGVPVTVRIAAKNSLNQLGAISNPQTATPLGLPNAPTITPPIVPGIQRLTVTFTKSTDTGGSTNVVYGYSVNNETFRLIDASNNPITEVDEQITFTIYTLLNGSSLQNGVTYGIRIRATNEAGNSPPSQSVNGTPMTNPDPPIINSITPGDKQMTVKFTPPENNGGSIVTSYQYKINNTLPYVTATILPLPSVNTFIIDTFENAPLVNGEVYIVVLQAVNIIGPSIDSGIQIGVPLGPPSAPRNIQITSGNENFMVQFTDPLTDGGTTIIRYEYTLNDDDPVNIGLPVNNTFEILGLTNGDLYSLEIRAVTSFIDGEWSSPVFKVAGLPTAPMITNTDPGDQSIIVTFQSASSNGLQIQGYKYILNNDTVNIDFPENNTFTIFGLENGSQYNVSVLAYVYDNTLNTCDGPASAIVQETPYTVPYKVTGVAIVSGNTELVVTFDPAYNGGSIITFYEYAIYLNNIQVGSGTTGTTVPLSFTVSSLNNCTTYGIQIRAYNAAGFGDYSDRVTKTVGLPNAPTIDNIDSGFEALTVTVVIPEGNGHTPSGYMYSVNNEIPFRTATNVIPVSYNKASFNITTYNGLPLINGVSYSIRVSAVNECGEGPVGVAASGTPAGPPDAPVISSVTAGDKTLTLHFTPPDDNGSAIEGYRYELNDVCIIYSDGTLDCNESGCEYTIPNLTNGSLYTVKLLAYNDMGDGPLSVLPGSGTPVTTPSAPQITSLVAGNGTITVNFTESVYDGGAPIGGYKYRVIDCSNNIIAQLADVTLLNTCILQYTIGGLQNGVEYIIDMLGYNSAGNGSFSNDETETPYTVPNAPVLKEVILANEQFTVTFYAPNFNGGRPITGYEYSLNDGPYIEVIDNSPIEYTFTVIGLADGSINSVKIRGINLAGPGNLLTIPNIELAQPPGSFVIDEVIAGNEELGAVFTPPTNGGATILGYRYKLNNTGPLISDGILTDYGDGKKKYTIPGLINGTSYTIQLLAYNYAGNGPLTSASQAAIPITVPNPPIIVSVVAGNQSLTVTYNQPNYDGSSPIDLIEYIVTPGGSYTTTASSPVNITGLTNGTTYTVSMRAHNAAGYSIDSSGVQGIPFTVPDAPTLPQVGAIIYGPGPAFTFNFIEPFNGGREILQYDYVVKLLGDVINSGELSPDNFSFTITGLTIGNSYNVEVYATNVAGAGALLQETVSMIVPDTPTNLSVTPGNGRLTITFTQPLVGGNPSGYKYTLNNGDIKADGTLLDANNYRISGLDNGTEYNVRLYAYNSIGNSAPAGPVAGTPATVPNPPIIVSIDGSNNGSPAKLTVNFLAPNFDGGSAVTAYQYSINYGEFKNTNVFPGTPFEITEVSPGVQLANGQTYDISMRANNLIGDGIPSESIAAIPYTVPSPPTLYEPIPDNSQFTINFEPTGPYQNGGSPVLYYQYILNGGQPVIIDKDVTQFTVLELTPGGEYTITLQAVNKAGASSNSNQKTVIIPLPPNQPTSFAMTPADEKLIVTFVPPSQPTNGPILGYKYELGGTITGSLIPNQITGNYEITGLINGTEYGVKIFAYNIAGDGTKTANVNATPARVPNAPTIVSVTPSNGILTVVFSAPNFDGGLPVDTYKYKVTPGMDNFVNTAVLPGENLVINSLTNGVEYSVSVLAHNIVGDGTPSDQVYGIPYTVPDAPTERELILGDGQFTLKFDAPFNGGRVITGYTYNTDPATTEVTISPNANAFTVTGLTRGNTYTVYLWATNIAGPGSIFSKQFTLPTPPAQITLDANQIIPGDESLTINFTAPNDGGKPILGYKHQVLLGEIECTTVIRSTGKLISPGVYVISGLINETQYRVKLLAYNSIGDGTYSNPPTVCNTICYPPP